jgi:hypothetical protein
MYLGLHSECPIFLPDFNTIWIFWADFLKVPNIRFQGNPSSGSHADTCRLTDVTKLIGDFCNHENVPYKVMKSGRMKWICAVCTEYWLWWSRRSVLAFGTQVRGFKPGQSRRIFKGEKNPQHAFLRRGSKAVCPMSQIFGT